MLRLLERASGIANRALAWFAGLALLAMMLFTVTDVAKRTLGRPVAGSFEVIGWLSASAMSLAVGYAQLHRSHVAMTLLSMRLRGRAAAWVEALTSLLSLGLFVAVAWYVAGYAQVLQATGSLSETLKAIVYPWVYVVALGFTGLVLALLLDAASSLRRALGD
ncbi:MAG: TRAP transporter small permease subunit [Burkholderiales bacterium]|nr:MAG: TRAP transporter small permease subunit [Burkholderiales bacterium]